MSDAPSFGPDDDLADIEALLRELEAADLDTTAPPADVWLGIKAAIRDDRSRSEPGPDSRPDPRPDPSPDTVVPISSRSSRLRATVLSIAAAVALLAVGAIVIVATGGGDDPVVASAELVHQPDFDPLGADAQATARLVERDGRFEIRLDDAELPDPDANDLELWLISTDADGAIADVQPVSLVDPDSPGTYAVPAALDPAEYSIVDISVEPRDGDEAHSGRSILRGTLADA